MNKNIIFPVVLLIIAIFTHYDWFLSNEIITSGDWEFQNDPTMREWFSMPYAWNSQKNIGSYDILLSFYGFKLIFGALATLDIPFNISERLLFLWPSVLIATFSMYHLAKRIFESSLAGFFSSLIYSLNTYILLLHGVGHLTVAMAYALLPAIFLYFKFGLEKYQLRYMIIAGLLLATSWFYDSRIGYIISLIIIIYITCSILSVSKNIKKYLIMASIPFVITFMIHNYWIISSYTIKYSNIQSIFPQDPWISWMSITHAVLLSHPFWTGDAPTIFSIVQPNIYMIFLPLLAFSSILFLRRENVDRKFILFLLLIASIGIILVKQENEPFGYIYTWLFHNFPGFDMFREASKFYILITFSYALLIGFSINEVNKKIIGHRLKVLNMIFLSFMLILIFYTAKPTFLGDMKGAYQTTGVQKEYVRLNEFIENQPNFFRTYWYPVSDSFGYYSNNHPMTNHVSVAFEELNDIFRPKSFTELNDKTLFNNFMDAISVKYIVIPYGGGIKGYESKRTSVKNMDDYSFQKINLTRNIGIFENKDYQDHFYIIDSFFERIDNDNWALNFTPLVNITLGENENSFNGNSDFLMVNSSIISDMTRNFTIDVDIVPKYMNQKGDIVVLIDNFGTQYGITYFSDDKGIKFGIKFGASLYNGTDTYFFDNNVRSFATNYNVSLTYCGGYLRLYVNDDKVKQVSASGKLVPLKGDVYVLIGKSTFRNTFFRGKIKSVKLFSVSLDNYKLKYLHDHDFPFNKSYLDNFHRTKKINVNYTYINPTLYNIRVNTSKPFMLAFAEGYDPYWTVHIDKIDDKPVGLGKIYSTQLYSAINGFWIYNTGDLSITVEYGPQRYIYIGMIISIITLTICIAYLIYDWIKKNGK